MDGLLGPLIIAGGTIIGAIITKYPRGPSGSAQSVKKEKGCHRANDQPNSNQ